MTDWIDWQEVLGDRVPVLKLAEFKGDRLTLVSMAREAADNFVGGHTKIVIDFGGHIIVDSATIGFLLGIQKRLKELGGGLYFAGICKETRTMFELLDLKGMLKGTVVDN